MKSLFILIAVSIVSQIALADWNIDLTRRQNDLKKMEMEELTARENHKNALDQIFEKEAPKEEIVIANTDKGFVPNTLRLKKDQNYQITVVNVNKKKKNVSFMLDAFAEHHGTYFGEIVSFQVKPQKDGLFQYVCPETETIGKILVYTQEQMQPIPPVKMRQPASEEETPVPVSLDYE